MLGIRGGPGCQHMHDADSNHGGRGETTYIVGGIGEVVVDVNTGVLLDEGVGHGGVVRCHLG